MDVMEVKDFLEDRCIHEENPELVIDHLQNPQYLNPLKMNFLQAPNPMAQVQAQGYNYMPDPRLAGGAQAGRLLPPIQQNMPHAAQMMGQ